MYQLVFRRLVAAAFLLSLLTLLPLTGVVSAQQGRHSGPNFTPYILPGQSRTQLGAGPLGTGGELAGLNGHFQGFDGVFGGVGGAGGMGGAGIMGGIQGGAGGGGNFGGGMGGFALRPGGGNSVPGLFPRIGNYLGQGSVLGGQQSGFGQGFGMPPQGVGMGLVVSGKPSGSSPGFGGGWMGRGDGGFGGGGLGGGMGGLGGGGFGGGMGGNNPGMGRVGVGGFGQFQGGRPPARGKQFGFGGDYGN